MRCEKTNEIEEIIIAPSLLRGIIINGVLGVLAPMIFDENHIDFYKRLCFAPSNMKNYKKHLFVAPTISISERRP